MVRLPNVCILNQLHDTILYYTILHYTTLHYTTLHYTTPYYTILYYNILDYTFIYDTIMILHYNVTMYCLLFLYMVAIRSVSGCPEGAPSAMFGATTTSAKPSMPCRTQVSESSKTPRQPDTISVKGVEAVKTLIKKLLWLKTRSGVSFRIPDLEASLSASGALPSTLCFRARALYLKRSHHFAVFLNQQAPRVCPCGMSAIPPQPKYLDL